MPNLLSIPPQFLKRVASQRFDELVLAEIGRSRERVAELQRSYPSAKRPELARRLVDSKKALAGTAGAVTGLFGLLAVPLDVVLVLYLQVSLLVDVAVLHGVNLKSARAQGELLDLLGYGNGVGPLVLAGPRVVGKIAAALFQRGGLPRLGRAVPVIASPLTAWLNNRALAHMGQEAVRFYAREAGRETLNGGTKP